jgi:hypothetical protein
MAVKIFGLSTASTDKTGHKHFSVGSDSADASVGLAYFPFDEDRLWVGRSNRIMPPANAVDIAGLRFDISSLAGKTVTAAKLRLHLSAAGAPDESETISIRIFDRQWGVDDTDDGAQESPATGGQATYAKAKQRGSAPLWLGSTAWGGLGSLENSFILDMTPPTFACLSTDGDGTEYEIDITTKVQDWVAGTTTNNGLALVPPAASATLYNTAGFASHTHATAAWRPELEVTYVGGGGGGGEAEWERRKWSKVGNSHSFSL